MTNPVGEVRHARNQAAPPGEALQHDVLPEMKEPVPRDMEHAITQIEVCTHGLFMAETLPHFNSLKAFMVYFWHTVHRHKDHDAPPGCRPFTVKEVLHSWEMFLSYLETQSRLLYFGRPADFGAKSLSEVVVNFTPASELTDRDVQATIAPKFNSLAPLAKSPPPRKGSGKGTGDGGAPPEGAPRCENQGEEKVC